MTLHYFLTPVVSKYGHRNVGLRANRRSAMMLSRREVRDLWRAAAKAAKANGDLEEMKRCQATAKLWS